MHHVNVWYILLYNIESDDRYDGCKHSDVILVNFRGRHAELKANRIFLYKRHNSSKNNLRDWEEGTQTNWVRI